MNQTNGKCSKDTHSILTNLVSSENKSPLKVFKSNDSEFYNFTLRSLSSTSKYNQVRNHTRTVIIMKVQECENIFNCQNIKIKRLNQKTVKLEIENEKLNEIIKNLKKEKVNSFNYLDVDQVNKNILFEKMNSEGQLNNEITELRKQLIDKEEKIQKLKNKISNLTNENTKLVQLVKKYKKKLPINFSRSLSYANQKYEIQFKTSKDSDSSDSEKSMKNIPSSQMEKIKPSHPIPKNLIRKPSMIEKETLISKLFEQIMKSKNLKELLTISIKSILLGE